MGRRGAMVRQVRRRTQGPAEEQLRANLVASRHGHVCLNSYRNNFLGGGLPFTVETSAAIPLTSYLDGFGRFCNTQGVRKDCKPVDAAASHHAMKSLPERNDRQPHVNIPRSFRITLLSLVMFTAAILLLTISAPRA